MSASLYLSLFGLVLAVISVALTVSYSKQADEHIRNPTYRRANRMSLTMAGILVCLVGTLLILAFQFPGVSKW